MKQRSILFLLFAIAISAIQPLAAQTKLTNDEWKVFIRAADRYDSLQTAIQKMVSEDPELQKNPSKLQVKLADHMKEINEIYKDLTDASDPAISTLPDELGDYPPDDLRRINIAAIATKKVDYAIQASEQLIKHIEDADSIRAIKMELAKYLTFMKRYDEAAAYATADVLAGAEDQDKLQFYPTIARGYAGLGNTEKAMLYAFKAIETMNSYRETGLKQLAGTEREQQETEMMNRYFSQEYTNLIYTVSQALKDSEELQNSFMSEAEELIANNEIWDQVEAAINVKVEEKKREEERYNSPAPEWAEHDWMGDETYSLESLKGKVIMVDFFATWCRPCIMAFPHIREWQEKYADQGLVVLGLTTYQGRYKGKEVTAEQEADKMKNEFIKENKISWPIGIEHAGTKTFERYGVQGIPHMVLIDKEGKLRYQKVGAAGFEDTEDMIKKLLAE